MKTLRNLSIALIVGLFNTPTSAWQIHKAAPTGECSGPYTTSAVEFDGTAWLSLASLSAPDSSSLSYSYWLYTIDNSAIEFPWAVDPDGAWATGDGINNVDLALNPTYGTTGGGPLLGFTSTANSITYGIWHHILVSVDTNHAIGAKIINYYLDDTAMTPTVYNDTSGAFNISFNGLPFFVGDVDLGFIPAPHSYMADFWFAPGQFVDFTVEANRRKFINAGGKPVCLGNTGSIPTGTSPKIFLRRAPAAAVTTFATDLSGNSNDFTITGTLLSPPSSPSD